MTNSNILICFGTRPEYVKVKSLIDHLPGVKTCFTGQHQDLIKCIDPTHRINMSNCTSNRLNEIIHNIMIHSHIFESVDYVIIQGDTTSALGIALSAFHHGKKIIHLEAGLRSGDLRDPFPEEMNRQLIDRISDICLCPTESNKQNLLKESVSARIYVVGNTGLDVLSKEGCEYGNQVLITMHRKDNHPIIDQWFEQFESLAKKYKDLNFVIPLHPNPSVQKHKHLLKNVHITEPMNHSDLINYLKKCKFVISDSGGLQEECSFLNKKIIVCRKTTERPESMGTHSTLCPDPQQLEQICEAVNNDYEINALCPYGNGTSYRQIMNILHDTTRVPTTQCNDE